MINDKTHPVEMKRQRIALVRPRKRKWQRTGLSAVFLLITLCHVHGFSARLSRPWEPTAELQIQTSPESRRFYKKKGTAASSKARVKSSSKSSSPSSSAHASKSGNNGENSDVPPKEDDGEASPEDSPPFLTSPLLSVASMAEESRSHVVNDADTRVNGAAHEKAPTVWSNLWPLFLLTRPANFPGIVLLHFLGGALTLSWSGQSHLFVRTMLQSPFMWVVLAALVLTSSTSMLVNDYYDTKLGRDADKVSSPLISGQMNLSIVRSFLNILYAVALICVAFVPGVPARVSVVVGLMLTFWYTKHLKPVTFAKNIMCATLIALSPFTSGSAALKVASEVGHGPWGGIRVLMVPSLWRLVGMLFFGVSGREVMMDITDLKDDAANRVLTIPVKYGRHAASAVALVCYLLGGLWVIGGPMSQLVAQLSGKALSVATLKALLMANTDGLTRRLLFASLGTFMLARRGIQVFRTQGEDAEIIDRTVNEAQLAMIIGLVSFI